jgi:hypothetical protein
MSLVDGRRLIQQVREGTQFAAPDCVTPLASATVADAAGLISSGPIGDSRSTIAGSVLAELSERFHRRSGTLTRAVQDNLQILSSDALRLRLAHQPNLFMSLGVAAQFVALDCMTGELKRLHEGPVSQFYLIVSHDSADDSRFGVAHLPSPTSRNGSVPLTGAVAHADKHKVMWAIRAPTAEMCQAWMTQIRDLAFQQRAELDRLGKYVPRSLILERLEEVESILFRCVRSTERLVDFNAMFISQIVNCYWGLPTAFVPADELQKHMLPAYGELIQLWPQIQESVVRFSRQFPELAMPGMEDIEGLSPLWVVCANVAGATRCATRVRLRIGRTKPLTFVGECTVCATPYAFVIGSYENPTLECLEQSNIAPAVLLDDLLDVFGLGVVGGVGYIGGAPHMALVNHVLQDLGRRSLVDFLWRPLGNYFSMSDCLAVTSLAKATTVQRAYGRLIGHREWAVQALKYSRFGRASIIHYLLNVGALSLAIEWKRLLSDRTRLRNFDNPALSPIQLDPQTVLTLRHLTAELEA